MQNFNKIILTVPHSVCKSGKTRTEKVCDLHSQLFAEKLYKKIDKLNPTIIYSKQNRRILDDNRFSNILPDIDATLTIKKNSELWDQLRLETKKYFDENGNIDRLAILDCHSFPNHKRELDLYFIDNQPFQSLTNDLFNFMKSKGLKTAIFVGKIGKNSIIDVHTLSGIPISTVLIEINESLSKEKVDKIAGYFAEFLIGSKLSIEEQLIKTNPIKSNIKFHLYMPNPLSLFTDFNKITTIQKSQIIMCVHGGASNSKLESNPEIINEITSILEKAYKLYSENKSSLEMGYQAVLQMEDSGKFNAGQGSIQTNDGKIEKEACIMLGDGKTGSSGMISSGFSPLKISKCLIDQNSDFIRLIGDGAVNYYTTNCMEGGNKQTIIQTQNQSLKHYGTVGCVCRNKDSENILCSATSTGGMPSKPSGRIGDSSIIGHGTYANNNTCAVSCTGIGEYFSKELAAYQIHSNYNLYNMIPYTLSIPVNNVLNNIQKKGGFGGIIALSKFGELIVSYTKSGSMTYGFVNRYGKITVVG